VLVAASPQRESAPEARRNTHDTNQIAGDCREVIDTLIRLVLVAELNDVEIENLIGIVR
jgi:hypothetical protein